MRKIKVIILIAVFMIGLLPDGFAVSKAEYSREYVIDDQIFKSSQTMSASAINDFFRSHGSWMTDYVIPEYISVPYPLASGGLGYASAHQVNYNSGAPLHSKTIAQLIYDEATEHGVNPRVILVVLQKESSAITRTTAGLTPNTLTWPLFYMYNESMESCLKYGTYCDDAAYQTLATDYGGVGLQIAYATNWFSLRQSQYDISKSFTVTVDGVTFTCQNASTRILYIYTPHISSWLNFHTIFTGWWEDPTYGPPIPNQPFNLSALKNMTPPDWSTANSGRMATGDFNGDGTTDAASLYDYGNCSMGLIIFESQNSFIPRPVYYTPPGTWCVSLTSNLVKGNFDNDGIDDLAVIYDYGVASAGIWVFKSSLGFSPVSPLYLPPLSWHQSSASEIAAGDFDNDGLDDIASLYNYGSATTALWVFESSNSYLMSQYYNSGPNNLSFAHTKSPVSGNYDGAGADDLAFLYDYGNNTLALMQMRSENNHRPTPVYISATNCFSLNSTSNLASGNFDGDTSTDDLAILYDYGDSAVGIFSFSTVSSYAPASKYWSGRKNFSLNAASHRVAPGDFNDDGRDDLLTLYNYGVSGSGLLSYLRAAID